MSTLPLFTPESSQSSLENPFSISEVTGYIRQQLETDPTLQSVWVEGEISNLSRPSSGHIYFTLKDVDAQLRCVMWRSDAQQLDFDLQDHDQILAQGRISVYEKGGQYQLYAQRIMPVGAGDLNRQLQILHSRLKAEGLFEPALKKPLPFLPLRIGIVTSSSTAAYQDVLNVLRRRMPLAEVVLSPTPVQGYDAPLQIVTALQDLEASGSVDVILLVRGGGSLEDLWCFNDERVVRAVCDCSVPIVTGVGHEIDHTLVDYAADMRAPTPSAAAEFVSASDIAAIRQNLQTLNDRGYNALETKIDAQRQQLAAQKRTLKHLSPRNQVNNARQRMDDLSLRLFRGVQGQLTYARQELNTGQASLRSNDPMSILARGYAVVSRRGDGKRLTSALDAGPGTAIDIQLAEGTLVASVKSREVPDRPKLISKSGPPDVAAATANV